MTETTKPNNNNDNKSLFFYTALIFFVALVLIILAFFGQSNIKRNQPEIPEATASAAPQTEQTGIAERASVLSEENRLLLEENDEIKKQLSLQTEEINRLNLDVQNLNKYKETNDLLMSANGYFHVENYAQARAVLDKIDVNTLTEDQKILYNTIKENLE